MVVLSQAAWAQASEKAVQVSVSPSTGLTSTGSVGGPFTPSSQQYTVSNTGDGTLAWSASANANWVTVQMVPAGSGTQLRVGSAFQLSGTVSIPVTFFRGTGTDAGRGPSTVTARITYDPAVLDFQGATASATLGSWYNKSFAVGETTPGVLNVLVMGIEDPQYEITTYDNEIAGNGHTPTQQTNPFPLGTIQFTVVGSAGQSTALTFGDLAPTDLVGNDAVPLTNVTTQSGIFTVASSATLPPQGFSGDGLAVVSLNANAQNLAGTPSGTQYNAVVTFTSNGGAAVTRNVALTVVQACTAPPAPTGIQASDGDFPAYVRVTWNASAGAVDYQVYRSTGTDPASATAVSGWIAGTSYNDTSAASGSGGGGCSGGGGATTYNYWVKARNSCQTTSAFSISNSGYRGASAKSARFGSVYESALPATSADETLLAADPSSPLALQVVADERLVPGSLWARVESNVGDLAVWEPHWADDGRSVWTIFTPESTWTPGEVVTVSAGATTVSGTPVVSIVRQFQIAVSSTKGTTLKLWQPVAGVDFDDAGLQRQGEADLTAVEGATVPSFAEGVGPAVQVGPETVFTTPQWVWLPVPADARAGDLTVYYYHAGGSDRGWYRGEDVEGWMVPGSAVQLDLEHGSYIGVLVRHGGIAQLGLLDGSTTAHASIAPVGGFGNLLGDAAVLLLAAGILVWRGRKARFQQQ